MQITRKQLIDKYIGYFTKRNHALISGRSLVPENDPTVLFTTAGMHPLVPYLQGVQEHPQGKRLVNVQRCVRTGDIDEVGDNSHLTFFEMLGNWSIGDYFKADSIRYSFEFLTSPEYLNIPLERLKVTVFAGDDLVPMDEEARNLWLSLGIPENYIFALGRDDNWWGPAGAIGPCGPDTEIFYDLGFEECGESCRPGCSCGKYVEIWNNVFMQYYKESDGSYRPLAIPCVDTGMGVERTLAVLNHCDSVYDVDIFASLISKICATLGVQWKKDREKDRSVRIISDHIRAAVMMLGDEQAVLPSNIGRGYVLRRLLRRTIQQAYQLGYHEAFLVEVAGCVFDIYSSADDNLISQKDKILHEIQQEEEVFNSAVERGNAQFQKEFHRLEKTQETKEIPSDVAFRLYDTYGFPLAMTEALASDRGWTVDVKGFNAAYEKHQALSRQGASQSFKGGLAGHSEVEIRYHTATHLLHEALRQVLGDEVAQKGSNITPERLRFDFSYSTTMTKEQVSAVENLVNEKISENLSVTMEVLPLDEAKKRGVRALFSDRYGEHVKVYSIGNFSNEVCGGPHVLTTQEIGSFKIVKEQSSSKGVRRIKAVISEK